MHTCGSTSIKSSSLPDSWASSASVSPERGAELVGVELAGERVGVDEPVAAAVELERQPDVQVPVVPVRRPGPAGSLEPALQRPGVWSAIRSRAGGPDSVGMAAAVLKRKGPAAGSCWLL